MKNQNKNEVKIVFENDCFRVIGGRLRTVVSNRSESSVVTTSKDGVSIEFNF